MSEQQTKTIRLSFEVPADLDLPSEDLARMKELLLEGLRIREHTIGRTNPTRDQALAEALLTES